MAYTLATHF